MNDIKESETIETQAMEVRENVELDKTVETDPDVISNDNQDAQDVTSSADQETEPGEANQDEANLPDGVTLAPRHPEEMHLDLIKDKASLIETYLAVSDDQGELLADIDLEKKVKDFCELHKNVAKEKLDNPNQLLQETRDLVAEYGLKVNMSEAIMRGANTKYRIREGMLFIIEKEIARKMGENWIDFFKSNHDSTSLRSAHDYMALAKITNVIRYSFLGKERLMEIQRAVKGSKEQDPIGTYLRDHGITFDPETDNTEMTSHFRVEIDALIAMTKINAQREKSELDLDVDLDLVRNLIGLGTRVDSGMIRDLVIIEQNGGNVNQYMERRYISGGAEEEVIRSTKKVTGFPKLVASLRSTVSYLRDHTDLASQINPSQIEDLEHQVTELKELLINN